MRVVLVCGGRTYRDRNKVRVELTAANPGLVLSGFAQGADTLGAETAKEMGVPVILFPANWEGEGRAAGHRRNQRMLDFGKPDLVLAFPGGPGTADMVRRAREAGVKVIEVEDA